MNIKLPHEQMTWLAAQVAAGQYASIDEALSVAVAELMALQNDDLSWARPYVDEALASVERGHAISGEEFFKSLDEKRAKLRAR